MVLQKLLDESRKLNPELPTLILSPPRRSALSLMPADIREIGAKRLLGFKLTTSEKARLDSYNQDEHFLKSFLFEK